MTTAKPSIKKMIIVRIGIRRTNKEIANTTVPIPRIESQRVVKSMCSPRAQPQIMSVRRMLLRLLVGFPLR